MALSSSGKTFVKQLGAEVQNSSAVYHPYLTALKNADLPNIHLALQDFAFQYGIYSASFVHYITSLLDQLTASEHKQILYSNLREEQGNEIDVVLPNNVLKSIEGKSHTILYRQFQQAIGVGDNYLASAEQNQTGTEWSTNFLKLCQVNQHVGIGAIGIGTELIVSPIYQQILEALSHHTELSQIDRIFFELHSTCDDHHAEQLLSVAEELASSQFALEQIAYGARTAVSLRSTFWDKMLERALQQSPISNNMVASEY